MKKNKNRLLLALSLLVALSVGILAGIFLFGAGFIGRTEYRTVRGASLISAEVPASWASVSLHEGSNPTSLFTEYGPSSSDASFSVSEDTLSYTDVSWHQIDIFEYWPSPLVEKYVATLPEVGTDGMYNVTVGGREVLAKDEPLDNGEVTKNGPGGRTYYVVIPEDDPALARLLIIRKQAQGDAEFEKAFQRFLNSIQFTDSTN